MPTNIDSLSIKISSNAKSAVSGIDALTKSLERLERASSKMDGTSGSLSKLSEVCANAAQTLDGASNKIFDLAIAFTELGKASKNAISQQTITQIAALGDAAKNIDESASTGLTALAEGLSKVSETRGGNLLSDLVARLTDVGIIVEELAKVDYTGLNNFTDFLGELSKVGDAKIGDTLAQLAKIPELAEALKNVDMESLSTALQGFAQAVNPLSDEFSRVADGAHEFADALEAVSDAADDSSESTKKQKQSATDLWSSIQMATKSVQGIAKTAAEWTNEANKYIEDLNLFTASMGRYADSAKKYADQVAEVMGIDPANWMRNQGVFQTLATGFGVAADRAAIMSQQLTQLGYDLSSFFNISVEDSMQKLQSGLAGELEPLRRLGYDLSKAKLEAIALDLGITKTYNNMSQAEKSQLRYYAIMKQVTVAQGDMARTLDAPANQLRILQAQVTQAARALGNIFIPMLNAVLPYLIAAAKAVRLFAQVIAEAFGFKLPEIDYSGLEAISGAVDTSGLEDVSGGLGQIKDNADDASSAAKKLKSYLMGFDELNVINPDSGTGGGSGGAGGGGSGGGAGGGAGDGWLWDLPTYDFLGGAISTKIDEIFSKIKPVINWVRDNIDAIKTIAAAIGAELLLWAIAKPFLPELASVSQLLSTIMGYALAGITLIITVALSYYFTNEYLETGNLENLVADAIVTAGGSMLIGGLVTKASGSAKWGYFAAGVSLVITGIVDLTLVTGNIIKEGLNWTNLLALTEDAIKVGVGSMLMTKALPESWSITKMDGFVFGFMLSAGVSLAISGISRYDYDKGFDTDSIKYLGGAATAVGIAVAKVAKHIGLAGWEGFVAGFGFTAGVELLVMGLSRWLEDGKFDADTIGMLGTAATGIGIAISRLAAHNSYISTGEGFVAGFTATAGVSLLVMGVSQWLKDGSFDDDSLWMFGVAAAGLGTALGKLGKAHNYAGWEGFAVGFSLIAGVGMMLHATEHLEYNKGFSIEMLELLAGVPAAAGAFLAGGVPSESKLAGFFAGAFLMVGVGLRIVAGQAEEAGDFQTAAVSRIGEVVSGAVSGLAFTRMTNPTASGGEMLLGSLAGASIAFTLDMIVEGVRKVESSGDLTSGIFEAILAPIGAAGAGLSIAAMAGKSLLAGGLIGFAIATVGIGIYAAIKWWQFNQEQSVKPDAGMWGQIELTAEEVHTMVENMFTYDVQIKLNLVEESAVSLAATRVAVAKKAAELQSLITPLKLGLQLDTESGKNILDTVLGEENEKGERSGGLVDTIQTYFSESKSVFTAAVTVVPMLSTTGDDLSGSALSAFEQANKDVAKQFAAYGDQLGKAYNDALAANFEDEEKNKQLERILKYITDLTYALTDIQAKGKLQAGITVALSDLNKEGMSAALAEAQKLLKEYKTNLQDTAKTELENLTIAYNYYDEIVKQLIEQGAPEDQIKYNEQMRDNIRAMIEGFDFNGSVEAAYQPEFEAIKRQFATSFQQIFSEGVSLDDFFFDVGNLTNLQYLADDSIDLMFDVMRTQITAGMNDEEKTIYLNAVDMFGFTGFESLSKDAQTAFVANMTDVFATSDWSELSTEGFTHLITQLSSTFGSENTGLILKQSGEQVVDQIAKGVNSGAFKINRAGGELVMELKDGTKVSLGKEDDTIIKWFKDLGVNIVDGEVQGIRGEFDTKTQALLDLFGIPYAKAAEETEVNSPSKLFMRLGMYLVQGLINGLGTLASSMGNVWSTLPTWFSGMIGKILPLFSGMNSSITSIFTGTVEDAENAWSGAPNWFTTHILSPLGTKFGSTGKSMSGAFSTAEDNAESAWSGISGWFSQYVLIPILSGFTGNSFKNAGTKASTDLSEGLSGVQLPDLTPKVILTKDGWVTVDGFVTDNQGKDTVSQKVDLTKADWTTVWGYVTNGTGKVDRNVLQGVELTKEQWNTVMTWMVEPEQYGTDNNGLVYAGVSLGPEGWDTVMSWTSEPAQMGTGTVNQPVGLKLATKNNRTTVSSWVGKDNMGDTDVVQNVGLGGTGWTPAEGYSQWVSKRRGTTTVDQAIGLAANSGWNVTDGYSKWVSNNAGSTVINQKIGLAKGWTGATAAKWCENNSLVGSITVPVNLKKGTTKKLEWTLTQDTLFGKPHYTLAAAGGIFNTGEMFIAREAGPELVGTIGNRTTVANNEQIVSGITSGVRDANSDVVDAINNLIAVVQAKDMSFEITDDDIGRAADRYKRKRGVNVNSGAFANSY